MNINDIDIVLFDLDGTIYHGDKIIDGANDIVSFFRKNKKKIFFTTNNSTKTRKQIYEKLTKIGIDCVIDEVVTSGYLAALNAKKNSINDIYIFGSKNLVEEFKEQGIIINNNVSAKNLLIGYDPNMTYSGLAEALQVALHADSIMACNKERTFPSNDAMLMPGCGAMVAPIEWCANRLCDYVIGKPNTLMLELLVEKENVKPNRLLVIGDTYESDIVMANNYGANSILISQNDDCHPFIVSKIGDIKELFEKD